MIERLFYYTSERLIAGQDQKIAPARQWYNLLKKFIPKEEEMNLNILSYLESLHEKRVSKAELLLYINSNRLEIDQIILTQEQIDAIRMDYTTAGLTNHKEIIITVPSVERYYTDRIHFTDVADGQEICWCRCGDLPDDHKKILVIDELQSNRHQDAHTNGYKSSYFNNYFRNDDMLSILTDSSMDANQRYDRYYDYIRNVYDNKQKIEKAVPDAPFRKWWEFIIKRMLHYAIDNGYDQMRIVGGRLQTERYCLDEKEKRGLKRLYDSIIIGFAKKYLSKWGINLHRVEGFWIIEFNQRIKDSILNDLQPLFRLQPLPYSNEAINQRERMDIDVAEGILIRLNDVEITLVSNQEIQRSDLLGWYDRVYDKSYVIYDNHISDSQLTDTIIKFASRHSTLSRLFGHHYGIFINGIYNDLMTYKQRCDYVKQFRNKIAATEAFCVDIMTTKKHDSLIFKHIYSMLMNMISQKGLACTLSESDLYAILKKQLEHA